MFRFVTQSAVSNPTIGHYQTEYSQTLRKLTQMSTSKRCNKSLLLVKRINVKDDLHIITIMPEATEFNVNEQYTL